MVYGQAKTCASDIIPTFDKDRCVDFHEQIILHSYV